MAYAGSPTNPNPHISDPNSRRCPSRRAFLATLAAGTVALAAGNELRRSGPLLAFGGSTAGVLVDFATGAPVAGAEVRAVSSLGVAGTPVLTDAQGRFQVPVPDGATELRIQQPRYVSATRPLGDFTAGTAIRIQRAGSDAATEQAIFAKPRQLSATGALPEGRGLVRANAAGLDSLSCNVSLKKADGSIVDLEMNEYLRGVVPSEMPAGWGSSANGGFEALKAQAVACRTYAARVQSIRGYLTAGESDQVWSPVYADESDRAIQATGYEILTSGGECVIGYYSSTCGGESTDGPFPYLVGKRCNATANRMDLSSNDQARWFYSLPDIDAYCKTAGSRLFRWQAYWDRPTLETILDTYLPLVPDVYRSAPYNQGELGTLLNIETLNRSISGKIGLLRIATTTGSWEIDHEYWIRSLLRNTVSDGPQYSAQFALSLSSGNVSTINAYGGGWGHSLGMCQYGAYGMAKAGRDYRSILGHYYPNAAFYQLTNCNSHPEITPGDRYLCRPGDMVKYTWALIPGYTNYKVEVYNQTGQIVSVSAIVSGNTYSLPAPGPAGDYTWYLSGETGGTQKTIVQRKLTTTDNIRRYYAPVVLNGSNW